MTGAALAVLALPAACGAADTVALASSKKAEKTAKGEFDWDQWARVVNGQPCSWLKSDELAAIGITGTPEPYHTAKETGCKWNDASGAPIFSAAVMIWEGGAVNLNGEREGQIREIRNGTLFEEIGDSQGSVTASLRKDRVTAMIFANSDEESALIYVNGRPTRLDTPEITAEKLDRVRGFADALITKYRL